MFRITMTAVFAIGVVFGLRLPTSYGQYAQTNLVSDGAVPANTIDPNLVNPWGLVFNPTGFSWVANNGSGLSTLYDGNGVPSPAGQPLIVNLPTPSDSTGAAATGIVFSGDSNFVVSNGVNSGPARFIFASEDGTLSGWAPGVPPTVPAPSTQAQLAADLSPSGAVFKGLAIGTNSTGEFLYATDFHNNQIDVFDSSFHLTSLAGSFVDPAVPAGFAPFGIQDIGSKLYVTYAQQDSEKHDNLNGAGLGYVAVYDTNGHLLQTLISGGHLNAPWGLTMAPGNFGAFSNDLLVGNFGDGTINAFDPLTGNFLGTLSDALDQPIANPGLWALQFGNGLSGQGTNQLFFTVGVNDEADGLYGKITTTPEPASVSLLILGGAALIVCGWRNRRSVCKS